jgi:peptidyl-prolyl cis-trans isomerase C
VTKTFPLIALLLVAAACSKANEGVPAAAEAGQGQQAAETLKPIPAELPEVIARVNGETINKGDFERAVQSLEGRAGGPVPAEQRDRVFRDVLDQLVGVRLLTQEAAARKVTVPEADIDAQIAKIQAQFPNAEAFNQVLAQRQMTVEQLKSDARREMAITKLLQSEVEARAAVTDAQINDFYAKNPNQFKQPERVRASHILISVAEGADATVKGQARAKAEQILKDVKAGKDFAALAKEHSQDPGSAIQGGDLGFFTQGQMVGPFNDTAFALAKGATSDLVETQFGFHIIRVVDKQPSRDVPLEEVRERLEQYLLNQNRQEQTEAFVKTLRAKGKVEVFI